MSISSAQALFGVQATGTATRPGVSGSVTLGSPAASIVFDDGDIVFTGRAVMTGAAEADVALSDFATSFTPDPATPSEITLNPSGTNNSIDIESTDLTLLTAAIVIDSTTDRTQLTAAKVGTQLRVTSGDKRVMIVTGSLTSNGSTAVTFPPLIYAGQENGKPAYTESALDTESSEIYVFWDAEKWTLKHSGSTRWQSTQNVVSPDLVTTWTAVSPATGTPTVTPLAASAASAITALNLVSGITAANTTGNDGTGTIAATSGSFTPGAESEWIEPQVDFQGYPYEPPSTILAILIHCVSGGCTIDIDDVSKPITAGEKIQFANQSGIFSTIDSIQLTNTTGATQVDVTVIASTT